MKQRLQEAALIILSVPFALLMAFLTYADWYLFRDGRLPHRDNDIP